MKKYIFLAFFISYSANSKDLGVYGEVFPIKEKNLLNVIKDKLIQLEESGEIDAFNEKMLEDFKDRINKPESILTTKAIENKERLYDPSVTLQKDIFDNNGNLILKKGQKANPLNHILFSNRKIYMIDGDDEAQINWILKQNLKKRDKVILTNGNFIDVEKKLEQKVYYDQNGLVTNKFNIKALPSVIERSPFYKNLLLIKEVFIDE